MMGLADRVRQLENRVDSLERRCSAVEDSISAQLDTFGGYRSRTASELADIRSQLELIITTLGDTIEAAENRADLQRTSALLRRARNNMTRVNRAGAALSA